jgi:hypothetical protein
MTDEIKAFDVFASVLCQNKQAVCGVFSARHGRRFDFDRLQRASDYRKNKLGSRLLTEYRRGGGEVGAIDWDKFKQWCMDHWKLILTVKIILTVLLLFCL